MSGPEVMLSIYIFSAILHLVMEGEARHLQFSYSGQPACSGAPPFLPPVIHTGAGNSDSNPHACLASDVL